MSTREIEILERVWAANGCERNPDVHKQSVRDVMWEQIAQFGAQALTRDNRIARENQRWELAAAAVRALHQPVDIEPSETVCGHCSYQLPNGRFFGKIFEWPCPTVEALRGESK